MNQKNKAPIVHLNVTQVAQMFIKASYVVEGQTDFLNTINVFPVPDGDTGSNMSNTLKGVRRAVQESAFLTFEDLGKIVSKSAMLSSRGNSGTLISQFFIGFCQDFKTIQSLNSSALSKAFSTGLEQAYRSFEQPRQGTALDILETATKVTREQIILTDNLEQILTEVVRASEIALENTRDILPEMQQANVVDSGAAGFVDILKGFLAGATNADIEVIETHETLEQVFYQDQDLEFRYCTEVIISDVIINDHHLKEKVKPLGDYIQIVAVDQYLKLHIHTNEPQKVREICLKYGQEENFKADDMQEMVKQNMRQNHSPFQEIIKKNTPISENKTNYNTNEHTKRKSKQKYIILTDSSIDLPQAWSAQLPIKLLPIPIFEGDSEQDISELYESNEFYKRMENEPDFHTKTSKINVGTYHEAFQKCLEMAEKVICLCLSSGISGSFESAKLAREMLSDAENLLVYDTQVSGAALAIMAKKTAEIMSFTDDLSLIPDALDATRNDLKIYFLVGNIKYLERSGRISKTSSKIGQFLKLQPLLTLENGKIKATKEKLFFSNEDKQLKLLIKKITTDFKKQEFNQMIISFAGENTRQLAQKIKSELILKNILKTDQINIVNLNLVVGSHTGPGTISTIYS